MGIILALGFRAYGLRLYRVVGVREHGREGCSVAAHDRTAGFQNSCGPKP